MLRNIVPQDVASRRFRDSDLVAENSQFNALAKCDSIQILKRFSSEKTRMMGLPDC